MLARVLIADDDEAIAMLLLHNLGAEGFEVETVGRGGEAEIAIAQEPPDALVLDWALPDISAVEFCRRMRQERATRDMPILILANKGEEQERLENIRASADDYVVKPFSVRQCTERLKLLLERANPGRISNELVCGDIALNRSAYAATRNGRSLRLPRTDFKLLMFLMERRGHVVNRQEIVEAVWGCSSVIGERTVDVYIGRLRKALIRGRQPDPIRTVRGVGYAFGTGVEGAGFPNGRKPSSFAFSLIYSP
jgi:two-component system phosphate regulon response regulator PhoB